MISEYFLCIIDRIALKDIEWDFAAILSRWVELNSLKHIDTVTHMHVNKLAIIGSGNNL